jgi:uncharacterized protein YlxW (UPF0749 family)
MLSIQTTLESLRAVIDEKERVAQRDAELSKMKAELEAEVRKFHEVSGLSQFRGAGLTISVSEKMRAAYEPEHWPAIAKWAVDTGHEYIIQRRLTDKKVLELIDNGVPLPEGLTVKGYTDISIRRN